MTLRLLAHPILGLSLMLAAPLAAQQPRPEGTWHLLTPPADSLAPPPRPLGPPGMGPAGPGRPGSGPASAPPGMGGPGEPGEMGSVRRPGRYARDLTEKDILRMRQTMRLGHHAPVTVRISPAEKLFVAVDSAGVEHRWPIGKETESVPADSDGAGGRVETSVKWKGDALVVEHRVDGGGKVRESYGVGLDGTRLVVFVEIDAGAMPTSYRRQYRKAE